MLWLLSLPFKLVFGILGAVLGLVGALLVGVAGLVLLPLAFLLWAPLLFLRAGFAVTKFLVVGVLVALAAFLLLAVALVPLVPLVLVFGAVWFVTRWWRPNTAVVG